MRRIPLVFLVAAAPALADAPVSLATRGFVERSAQTADSLRNTSAASFGAPNYEDHRLFKLRWRLPVMMMTGLSAGPAPTVTGFSTTTAAMPGGLSLATEPMQGASSFIPQLSIGQSRKLGQVQAGVLSQSMGHGTLVDRYTNGPDGDVRRVGVGGEINLAGLGVQAMVGDVTSPHTFFAARVHGRPLMWFTSPEATFEPNELDVDLRTEVNGIWVTGFSVVVDADAPVIDEVDFATAVWGASWDNEAALLDNQIVKAIGYLDLNVLGGGLFRAGVAAHPGVTVAADVLGNHFDATGEVHVATDNYVPRYFDRLYQLERTRAFGSTRAKAGLDMPASAGYSLQVQAGLLQAITVFAEAKDATAFDPTRGGNNATLSAGASAWLFFLGGNVTVAQTGIRDYFDPRFAGPGFMVMGEARLALMMNFVHVVARAWRMHTPVDAQDAHATEYVVENGGILGMEMNFDVL